MKKTVIIPCWITGALLVRILYLLDYSKSPLFRFPTGPDIQEYCEWSAAILSGQWLWKEPHIHAPLYPYFLAAVRWLTAGEYGLIRFLQLLLNLLPGLLLFLVIIRWKPCGRSDKSTRRNTWAGVLFLALYTIYPPLIYFQAELISESLSVFWLIASVFALTLADRVRSRRVPLTAAAGLLCGLAIITHPLSIFFAGLEIIWQTGRLFFARRTPWKKERIFVAVLFPVALLLPLLPVSVYNSWIAGRPMLVQENAGFNFFLGNHPEATGTCHLRPGPEWDSVHAEAKREADSRKTSRDRVFLERSLRFMTDHPLQYIGLLARKARLVIGYRELPSGADLGPLLDRSTFLRLTRRWAFGLLATAGLVGLLVGVRFRNFRQRYRHVMILFVSTVSGLVLTVVSARYRLPLVPCLMVFAAAGLPYLPEFIRKCKTALKKERRTEFPIVFAIITVPFLVWTSPSGGISPEREKAESETILGEAYLLAGEVDMASACIESSIDGLPPWSRTFNLLGAIREAQGRDNEAEILYRRAAETGENAADSLLNIAIISLRRGHLDQAKSMIEDAMRASPDSSTVLYNAGLLQQTLGNYEDACRFYEQSLAIAPGFPNSWNNLGAIHLRHGNPEEAVRCFKNAVRIAPKNSRYWANLASALAASGYEDQARRTFERAVRLDPSLRDHFEEQAQRATGKE